MVTATKRSLGRATGAVSRWSPSSYDAADTHVARREHAAGTRSEGRLPGSPDLEAPLALLDDALELPLTPDVERIEPNLDLCVRLYGALRDYHRANRLGPMDRRRLRPNLSFVGFGSGVLVNAD